MENTIEDQKFKQFLASILNSDWAKAANENTIDDLFKSALDLEESFIQNESDLRKESILKSFCSFDVKRLLDIVLENIIKNQLLDVHLTLYGINKYIYIYSKEEFFVFLKKIFSEVELRTNLYKLLESFTDVDLDFLILNKFLCDILNGSGVKTKIENALKCQALTFLNAVKYGETLTSQYVMNEVIHCLEAQSDLRLWFTVMKEKNLETILDLCVIYSDFFNAILRFFDKFAEEIESNYDEELNVQYSHVNLDFEDFLKIFQLFLKHKNLKKLTAEYLASKTLSDKNFCFWLDVKACI